MDDAAPIRDPDGRFAAGNPGRRRGSRNRMTHRLAMALLEDFSGYEAETLSRLREWFFPLYVQLMARFVPRQTAAARPDFADYSPAERQAVLAAARQALARIERGEAGLDGLLTVLEQDPSGAAKMGAATVDYGESTVPTEARGADDGREIT